MEGESYNIMTEPEIIIANNILPRSFFEPETICDFYVDEKRKRIWAVLIDLLITFDKVCRKHGLKYYMAFGSLIGIIRHNGFIPWDDDIDVCMPRGDYDKLMSLSADFHHPYFLQIPGNDHEYYFSFAKLRNSNTSCISKAFRYEHFNQGMMLDIFPLDNYCEENGLRNYLKIKDLIDVLSVNMRRNNKFPSESDIIRMAQCSKKESSIVFNEMDSIARSSNRENTDKLVVAVSVISPYYKLTLDKKDISELHYVDFYGYQVPIPIGYDHILRTTYGDYMQLPPLDKRGVWHNSSVVDPDVPYLEILKELHAQDELAFKDLQ